MAPGSACLPRLRQRAGRSGPSGAGVFQPRTGGPDVRPLPARPGRRNSWELTAESRALAAEMLRRPVGQVAGGGADLRRFLVQQIESHVERRLVTAKMFES